MKNYKGWLVSATHQHGKYGWLIVKAIPGFKSCIASDQLFSTPEAARYAAIKHLDDSLRSTTSLINEEENASHPE